MKVLSKVVVLVAVEAVIVLLAIHANYTIHHTILGNGNDVPVINVMSS